MDYSVLNYHPDRSVVLSGNFTFGDTQKFKAIIDSACSDRVQSITLDFAKVEFIDSVGLGMMLLLRNQCQENNISINVGGAGGQVEKMFILSKFDQLFPIKGKD